MSKTIYLVTSGSYSDYGVVAVYDDEALAKKAVEMGYGTDIDERELNEHGDELRAGRANYAVYAWLDEQEIRAGISNKAEPLLLKKQQKWWSQGGKRPMAWFISGTVEASSEDHAKKILAEKIAQIKVEGGAPDVAIVQETTAP
jgi:hypothetical protein